MNPRIPILSVVSAVLLAGCDGAPTAPAASPTAPPADATPSPSAAPTLKPLASSLTWRKVTVGALERSYFLYTPKTNSAGAPLPLVFIFHGYASEGADMILMTGFNKLAEAGGFLAAYPDGTGPAGELSWNAGACCGSAAEGLVDESAFVKGILADLAEAGAAVDPKRIFATGLSNGAMLSYRLACEMSETFAAVAPVAGALVSAGCRPTQAVSILHIHGSADDVVPFAGGANAYNPAWPSVPDGISDWAGFDRCHPVPQVGQEGIATHTVYSACADGSAVELYLLDGVGHQWTREPVWPASQTIWEFFAAHPKA